MVLLCSKCYRVWWAGIYECSVWNCVHVFSARYPFAGLRVCRANVPLSNCIFVYINWLYTIFLQGRVYIIWVLTTILAGIVYVFTCTIFRFICLAQVISVYTTTGVFLFNVHSYLDVHLVLYIIPRVLLQLQCICCSFIEFLCSL